jgi:tetratricopeptide (TPR) repeat protein
LKENPGPIERLFEDAQEAIRIGQARKALSLLFRLLQLDPVHERALVACSRIMTTLNDLQGAESMKALAQDTDNPDLLYRNGFHLVTVGRPDVGKAFLEACLKKVGHHPDVMYELAYCHYRDRKFSRAADLLKRASKDLSLERAVHAELLMIECLLYADRVEEGRELLNKAGDEYRAWGRDDTVDALELMFARNGKVGSPRPWDLRTWHFVQHGGILLAQSEKGKAGGHFESLAMNALAVGGVLRLLKGVLDGLKISPAALLYLNRGSYILALATGMLLDRPVRSWENRSSSDEFLVIPDLLCLEEERIQPVNREDCANIFCFQVFPLRPYAVTPEIVGLIATRFRFPWQERVEMFNDKKEGTQARNIPEDSRDPEQIAGEIAEAARVLPEDSKLTKILGFYKGHRNMLLSTLPDRYLNRRRFDPLNPA